MKLRQRISFLLHMLTPLGRCYTLEILQVLLSSVGQK